MAALDETPVIIHDAPIEAAVRQCLESERVDVIAAKTIQGFGQVPGLVAGENTILWCSSNLRDTTRIMACMEGCYVPGTIEEAQSTINKLFSSDAAVLPAQKADAMPVSDRVFSYNPLTTTAVSTIPAMSGTELLEKQLESALSIEKMSEVPSVSSVGSPPTKVSMNFKARPIPPTHGSPSIQPRLSKAAALRMGITLPENNKRPTLSEGMKIVDESKASVEMVKSLGSPRIAPRPTKSSVLRAGTDVTIEKPVLRKRESSNTSERSSAACFENVPGHKRRSTAISVASTQEPLSAPRMNKAAQLRTANPETQSKSSDENVNENGVYVHPVSVARVAVSTSDRGKRYDNVPGYKRESLSFNLKALQQPTIMPRATNASSLRTGSPAVKKEVSVKPLQDSKAAAVVDKRQSSIVVKPPSIQPRLNKSAALRAGLKEEQKPLTKPGFV